MGKDGKKPKQSEVICCVERGKRGGSEGRGLHSFERLLEQGKDRVKGAASRPESWEVTATKDMVYRE